MERGDPMDQKTTVYYRIPSHRHVFIKEYSLVSLIIQVLTVICLNC
uniref:Uncharacterized protein n=1 Tax=Lepeophtheirus salmonis TaxID=72036 RepID=A0A0K2T3G0_LEPSM